MIPHLYALPPTTRALVEFLSDRNRPHQKLFPVVLGRLLAYQAACPSAPVDNLEDVLATLVRPSARTRLSRINEFLVHDTNETLRYVDAFYKLRYKLIFPDAVRVSSDGNAVLDFLGVSRYLDPAACDALAACPNETSQVAAKLELLLMLIGLQPTSEEG